MCMHVMHVLVLVSCLLWKSHKFLDAGAVRLVDAVLTRLHCMAETLLVVTLLVRVV